MFVSIAEWVFDSFGLVGIVLYVFVCLRFFYSLSLLLLFLSLFTEVNVQNHKCYDFDNDNDQTLGMKWRVE